MVYLIKTYVSFSNYNPILNIRYQLWTSSTASSLLHISWTVNIFLCLLGLSHTTRWKLQGHSVGLMTHSHTMSYQLWLLQIALFLTVPLSFGFISHYTVKVIWPQQCAGDVILGNNIGDSLSHKSYQLWLLPISLFFTVK